MHLSRRGCLALTALAVIVGYAAPAAHADSQADLTGQYFRVTTAHPDFGDANIDIDGHVVTGLVESGLGTNGLPVASVFGRTGSFASGNVAGGGHFLGFDAGTNELDWWTPNGGTVTADGVAAAGMGSSLDLSSFYPSGGSFNGGANGFRTAHFFGTFTLTNIGTAVFDLNADDDAWLFIDGELALDNGGVKDLVNSNAVMGTLNNLSAGTHTVDLFFADRHEIYSDLEFNISVASIPEPAFVQFGSLLGFGGLLAYRRRARKTA
jgi:fibro-slime domain-containing protein